MNILTTVFLRYDNLKIMYPNSLLWQKSINNYYRSPDMGDAIEFCVHITTPLEKLNTIKQRISKYQPNTYPLSYALYTFQNVFADPFL